VIPSSVVLLLRFLFLTEVFLTLTEVFPCFFLSCKANARVKLAKTGHGPHYSTLVVICFVRLLFVLFYVLFVCKCLLPPGDNPIAVNKYICGVYCIVYVCRNHRTQRPFPPAILPPHHVSTELNSCLLCTSSDTPYVSEVREPQWLALPLWSAELWTSLSTWQLAAGYCAICITCWMLSFIRNCSNLRVRGKQPYCAWQRRSDRLVIKGDKIGEMVREIW